MRGKKQLCLPKQQAYKAGENEIIKNLPHLIENETRLQFYLCWHLNIRNAKPLLRDSSALWFHVSSTMVFMFCPKSLPVWLPKFRSPVPLRPARKQRWLSRFPRRQHLRYFLNNSVPLHLRWSFWNSPDVPYSVTAWSTMLIPPRPSPDRFQSASKYHRSTRDARPYLVRSIGQL